jgi:hypothetical protein
MQGRVELWQESFGYWQNHWIAQNILSIGYTAWNGYIYSGLGMVVCWVQSPISSAIDWTVDTVAVEQTFIPYAQVTAYLPRLHLTGEAAVGLLSAIATYDPTQAIVIVVIGNGAIDINLLQNLKVPPADCYAQVRRRWSEFQPNLQPLETFVYPPLESGEIA